MPKRSGWQVFCMWCHLEIEGCAGKFGDWMHTTTRREVGDDGHLAAPEPPESVSTGAWQAGRRRPVAYAGH